MMNSKWTFAMTGLALVVLTAQPAAAGKRSFFIDPYSVRATNGTSRDLGTAGTGGLVLPDNGGGFADFGFGFTIPKPYKLDSSIRIIFTWSTQDTTCGIVLEPEFVERGRAGHVVTTGTPSGGLTPENATTVLTAPAVASEGGTKVYLLNPDQGFTQQSDDAILLAFLRNDSSVNDTCTSDLVITGIKIEYLTP